MSTTPIIHRPVAALVAAAALALFASHHGATHAQTLASLMPQDVVNLQAGACAAALTRAAGLEYLQARRREVLRLQHGGCEKFTARQPCQISQPFVGARFGFLAANTERTEDGRTLLPATGIKRFTEGGVTVTLCVIGLTLQATPTMVSPSGVAGLRFEDEAATANALIPLLRAQGADVIAVVIHEGGGTTGPECRRPAARASRATSCPSWSGWTRPWTWWSRATRTRPMFATTAA